MRGRKSVLLFAGALMLLIPLGAFALQDGQCRTPPMGWNSWNNYACNNLNENVVLQTAAAFVKKHAANWEGKQISLNDVGYQYVNLDDCWATSARSGSGRFQVNTSSSKFPHCSDGTMKWLADSVHKMGLKLGIYSCAGTQTCAKTMPGSYQHDSIDAETFAEWGIDYLKYDWCNVPSGNVAANLYSKMSHALRNAYNKAGKGFIFSICEWGSNNPWNWGDSCGHLWRTTGDINSSWSSITGIVDKEISNQVYKYAKAGSWADPDMLEVGRGSLTAAENQAHFDLWCIQAAPLLMGNDVTAMTEATFTILSNREVIAVDQDSLGVTGRRVRQINSNVDVWVKKLSSPDTVQNRKFAVVLFNRSASAASGVIKWSDIGETQSNAPYIVRDLWKHSVIDSMATDSIVVASIPTHGTVHYLLTRKFLTGTSQAPQSIAGRSMQIGGRTTARGIEIYVPSANSKVRVFDVQGKQIAAFDAVTPAWYGVGRTGIAHGACVVSITSAGKTLVKTLSLVR